MIIMQQPPEITVANLFTEHLAKGPRLMEMILERGNMFKALARVCGNKGVRSWRIEGYGLSGMPMTLSYTLKARTPHNGLWKMLNDS